jgi:hypothetical protein
MLKTTKYNGDSITIKTQWLFTIVIIMWGTAPCSKGRGQDIN